MQTSYLKLLSAPFLFSSALFAEPQVDGPLVQRMGYDYHINPIFSPSIVEDLHYLIKRSYSITHRDGDSYDYTCIPQLTTHRTNSFRRYTSRSSFPDLEITEESVHEWFIHRPFAGTHGSNDVRGIFRLLPRVNHVESDYVGFTALLQNVEGLPPIIAIVFRGSQAQSFQRLNGMLGASWLTNLSARKMTYPESFGLPHALFHRGYLERYGSARLNIFADVQELWNRIPANKRSEVRIIITGHSQGGGVTIPAAADIVKNLGQMLFGSNFDNVRTPRFFVYALSSPNTVGDRETKQLVHDIVGRDNILCHCSIFDIVTYACPGERYNKVFLKNFLRFFAGIEAGFHPVGHFAFDDPIALLRSGCQYTEHRVDEDTLQSAEAHLKRAYASGVERRQRRTPFACFKKVKELYHIAQAIHNVGGLKLFVGINHYGSTTANEQCVPGNRIRHGNRSMTFDPRLVETDLKRGLHRGMMHRRLIKNYVQFSPDQISYLFSNDTDNYETNDVEFEVASDDIPTAI